MGHRLAISLVLYASVAQAAYIIPTPQPTATPMFTATPQPTATPVNTPVPTATVIPTATPITNAITGSLTDGRVALSSGTNTVADTANFTFDRTNFRIRIQNATTATDNTINMDMISGTLPTVPSTTVYGTYDAITSAGSAAQGQIASVFHLLAGYTGNQFTRAFQATNQAAGTGNTLNLNSATGAIGNAGFFANVTPSVAGINLGAEMVATGSTGTNIGVYAKAPGATAGQNIGVLGNAAASTEGTDLKNVAGYFTLNSALVAASNISVALVADNGAVASPIFNAYDNGTLVFSITDGGPVTMTSTLTSSRSTDLGWTVQNAANQACNTTCTTGACVVGLDTGAVGNFLACTDATADTCLCAG